MKGKSSINLTSLVEFEHHLTAETIRNKNEEKKIKVKAPVNRKFPRQKCPVGHLKAVCIVSASATFLMFQQLLAQDLQKEF